MKDKLRSPEQDELLVEKLVEILDLLKIKSDEELKTSIEFFLIEMWKQYDKTWASHPVMDIIASTGIDLHS